MWFILKDFFYFSIDDVKFDKMIFSECDRPLSKKCFTSREHFHFSKKWLLSIMGMSMFKAPGGTV